MVTSLIDAHQLVDRGPVPASGVAPTVREKITAYIALGPTVARPAVRREVGQLSLQQLKEVSQKEVTVMLRPSIEPKRICFSTSYGRGLPNAVKTPRLGSKTSSLARLNMEYLEELS